MGYSHFHPRNVLKVLHVLCAKSRVPPPARSMRPRLMRAKSSLWLGAQGLRSDAASHHVSQAFSERHPAEAARWNVSAVEQIWATVASEMRAAPGRNV